jgi:hypothetical protein
MKFLILLCIFSIFQTCLASQGSTDGIELASFKFIDVVDILFKTLTEEINPTKKIEKVTDGEANELISATRELFWELYQLNQVLKQSNNTLHTDKDNIIYFEINKIKICLDASINLIMASAKVNEKLNNLINILTILVKNYNIKASRDYNTRTFPFYYFSDVHKHKILTKDTPDSLLIIVDHLNIIMDKSNAIRKKLMDTCGGRFICDPFSL